MEVAKRKQNPIINLIVPEIFLATLATELYYIYNPSIRKRGEKAKMVLLEKLWDDIVAGPHPERGLGKLRKVTPPKPLNIKG